MKPCTLNRVFHLEISHIQLHCEYCFMPFLIKLNENCDNWHLLRRTFEAATLSWRASLRSLPLTKPKETYIDIFPKHLLLQIVQQEWTVVVNLPFLVGQSHDSQLSGAEPHRASGSYPVWKQKFLNFAFLKIYQKKLL